MGWCIIIIIITKGCVGATVVRGCNGLMIVDIDAVEILELTFKDSINHDFFC